MLFECLKNNASQRVMFILQTLSSKGVQKNMLKDGIYQKYTPPKMLWTTNILENGTGEDTFNSCFEDRFKLQNGDS